MTARDEAIEAAARAICADSIDCEHSSDANFDECRLVARCAVDAIRVPVLLNDLADRIEEGQVYGMPHAAAEWNLAITHAAEVVRAAAEGWGA